MGSSHGSLIFYANYLLNIAAFGYDISQTRINKATESQQKFNVKNITFINDEASYARNFSTASIIWLFDLCWHNGTIQLLSDKIKKECSKCWIIYMSRDHTIGKDGTILINNSTETYLLYYKYIY